MHGLHLQHFLLQSLLWRERHRSHVVLWLWTCQTTLVKYFNTVTTVTTIFDKYFLILFQVLSALCRSCFNLLWVAYCKEAHLKWGPKISHQNPHKDWHGDAGCPGLVSEDLALFAVRTSVISVIDCFMSRIQHNMYLRVGLDNLLIVCLLLIISKRMNVTQILVFPLTTTCIDKMKKNSNMQIVKLEEDRITKF